MLLKEIFLLFFGICAGSIVAAGVYAFLAIIGVFPRLIGKTGTKKHVLLYETMIILGGMAGNILDLYEFPLNLGAWGQGTLVMEIINWGISGILAVFGVSVGVFVGCLVMSLAETLKALPVMNRRIHLAVGFQYVILGIGIGKLTGALVYFAKGMSS